FSRKCPALRGCGICAGTAMHLVSHGEKCIPLRQCHACDHHAHSAFKSGLDCCGSPLLRSFGWNPRRSVRHSSLAGTSRRIRETERGVSRGVDSSADANHARIVRSARSEFWKFRRMQNSCENFEAVDNARPGTRKVCTGIYDIDLAGLRGGNGIKTAKSPEQFVIAARSIDVVPAK